MLTATINYKDGTSESFELQKLAQAALFEDVRLTNYYLRGTGSLYTLWSKTCLGGDKEVNYISVSDSNSNAELKITSYENTTYYSELDSEKGMAMETLCFVLAK